MYKKLVFTCAAAVLAAGSYAQNLFTYGGKPVTKEEFLRVYKKNAINKQADMSDTALRSYLDLYSLFKMKVNEAELMRLDTVGSINRELDNYRRQLAKSYLTDQAVTERLVKEAYDRMKEEVHVAHIMISSPSTAAPSDTAKAYAKADSVYKAILNSKASFEDMARQFSDDKGSKERGGDIGYLTGLQTLYPFENAAYNTQKGKIAAPFRTQFGYHIMKVLDRRPSRGELSVAQILIPTPKTQGDDGIKAARLRADSAYALAMKGVSFDSLVARYSEDKFTKAEGGKMPTFGVGRMVPAFEAAAFALSKPGDISAPVQTEYGFHIIKLLQKMPLKPFDSLKDGLKRRVDNDSRAQYAREQFFNNMKKKNGFTENRDALKTAITSVTASMAKDTGMKANMFRAADFKNMSQPVFTLGQNKYLQSDFISFAEQLTRGRLMQNKEAALNDIYKLYVERTVNDYEEHRLETENADFRNLMDEYRNGIMLFELMGRNVWNRASEDSAGLATFYESNKQKYQWEPGFTGVVYRFKDEAAMNAGLSAINANVSIKDEDIYEKLNGEKSADAVSIQRGRFEFSRFSEVPRAGIAVNKASSPVKNADGSYTVVVATEMHNAPAPKTLTEARGYVVADYQDYLEKNWNESLRKKYPVSVDQKVYKSMVKK